MKVMIKKSEKYCWLSDLEATQKNWNFLISIEVCPVKLQSKTNNWAYCGFLCFSISFFYPFLTLNLL
jgi:hypothetical protein